MGSVSWNLPPQNSNNDNMALLMMSFTEDKRQTASDTVYSKIFLDNKDLQKRKEQSQQLRNLLNNIKAQQNWSGSAWDFLKNGFGSNNCLNNIEKIISDYENGYCTYEQVNNAIGNYLSSQNMIQDKVSIAQSATIGALEGLLEWDRTQTEKVQNTWSNSDIGALARGDFKTSWNITKNSSAAQLVQGNFREALDKFGAENKNLSTALGFETAKDGYKEAYHTVEKAVDDGNDKNLSTAEKAVAIVGGFGDFADEMLTPVGLASLPVFNGIIKGGNWVLSKLPSFVGKAASAGLVADGSKINKYKFRCFK